MVALFKGTLGKKKVIVFATPGEATEYCLSHKGYDFQVVRVYAVHRITRGKRG